MEKSVERKENLEVVVNITINGDEWTKAWKKEHNKRAANVTVPGFRKGKAPANMINARINHGQVLSDVMVNLANKAFNEAVNENRLYVFSQPQLSVSKMNDDEVVCAVSFCLPPVIKLGQYKNLNVACDEVKASAKEVSAYIEDLKKQHAVMQVKEGAAKLGDTVIIDFVGYVDGDAFDGGSANGYELELGSNSFIPGFEDQLVGIKAGESRKLECKFPENYVEALKGKDATFDVTCQDVKEKVLPEINDEFIKELNIPNVSDEKSLKEYAKVQVMVNKQRAAKNAQVEKIVNLAVDNAEVQIPSSMIIEEANAMLEQIKSQVENAGLTYADYVAINGLKEEELDANRKAEAAKNLKSMLVVEQIIANEHLEANEAALEREYASLASQYGMSVASVKQALEPNKDNFAKQLRNKLFTEFMLVNNEAKVEAKVEAPASEEAPAKKAPAKKTTKKAAAPKAEGEEKPAAKKATTKKSTSTAKKTTTKKVAKKDAE